MALILGADNNGNVVASGCIDKVVQTLQIDGGQFIDKDTAAYLSGSVDNLEKLTHQHCQSSPIDLLPCRIISHADDGRMVRVVNLEGEIVT